MKLVNGSKTSMRNNWRKHKNQFRLPMTVTFSIQGREDGKAVAHALEFDLVSVADSRERAVEKLRFMVKTYIEFGLSNNWAEDIIFPAPDEFWDRIPEGSTATAMPPIEIEDNRVFIFQAIIAE